MPYTLGELARLLGNNAQLPDPDYRIGELAFDTRSLTYPSRTLFFALQSGSRDGHSFIPAAYSQGVRAFVVEHGFDSGAFPGSAFLEVDNPLHALQAIAGGHRGRFRIPVVGITGSNGKTIVKEWLYQLLSPEQRIVRSPKSYNSQIGVAMSLWLMEDGDELALIEAGISEQGEMARLAEIIKPTIGIFTNLGPAHSEGFASQEEKAREKALLFRESGAVICCHNHEIVYKALHSTCPGVPLFSWGKHPDADVQISGNQSSYEVSYGKISGQVELPFTDPASVENALHCLALMLYLDYPLAVFNERIRHIEALPLRLELKAAQRDSILVYDCYNSDVRSLQIALDMLHRHAQDKPRLAILSDIAQSGMDEAELYREVANMLKQRGVRMLWAVGAAMERQADTFRNAGLAYYGFADTDAVLESDLLRQLEGHAVLLKGARHFRFERIGRVLEARIHGTVLEISLPALAHNLKVYRSLVPPGTRIMAMVKAFGYGSGSHEIAHLLQHRGADMLAVAYTEEGTALRKARISLPIMVMNPDPEALPRLLAHNLEPEIYSLYILKQLVQVLPQGTTLRIHLKVETGMHRLGLDAGDLGEVLSLVRKYGLEVASVFTHLSASEDPARDAFTRSQYKRFEAMYASLAEGLGYHPLRHVLNSAGITRFPEFALDMVRPGLGLYGIDPSGMLGDRLHHVASLHTIVSQVKDVSPGMTVGYGADTAVEKPMRIATVAVGYADGYSRALSSGKGYMLVRGKQAPVVGRVCMDMAMLDVSHIPGVEAGDDVLVFGPELPVDILASRAGTIPHEILAGISQRVKRVYIDD